MKVFRWIIRSIYLLLLIGISYIFYTILPGIVPPMLGVFMLLVSGFFAMSMNKTKLDEIIKITLFCSGLLLLVGSFIKIDSNVTQYVSDKEYKVGCGGHPGDIIKSSYMIWVNDTSDILKHKNLVNFSEGSWFIYVGKPADKRDFNIVVEENTYLTGVRSYVTFIHKGKEIKDINTKRFR